MTAKTPCPVCSLRRPIDEHLFELGSFCELLANESKFISDDGPIVSSLTSVGAWLKLAAHLEKVAVNAWKYESSLSAMYCRPAAEYVDSSSIHQSNYATDFTKFMFVVNAFEEVCRFVDRHYHHWADSKALKKRPTLLVRAATLSDLIDNKHHPAHFEHFSKIFIVMFMRFVSGAGLKLSGMSFTSEDRPSYALHLLRNLRNFIAHGTLLPGDHPDYDFGGSTQDLAKVLRNGTRMIVLYIQLYVHAYNSGFQSGHYMYVQTVAEEEQTWRGDEEEFAGSACALIERCTAQYLLNLHMKGDFAIHGCAL